MTQPLILTLEQLLPLVLLKPIFKTFTPGLEATKGLTLHGESPQHLPL